MTEKTFGIPYKWCVGRTLRKIFRDRTRRPHDDFNQPRFG
jgi:hypothetical protein